jgi:hypothetical protein
MYQRNLFLPLFSPPDEGGGGAAPASGSGQASPTSDVSSTPSSPEGGDDFSGLTDGGRFDEDEVSVELPLPDAHSEGSGVPKAEVPAKAPEAPPPGPKPEVQQKPPEAQPSPKEPIPPAPSETAKSLPDLLTENREGLIEALASERFALSPAEVEALEADAVGVVPKLLSKVYLDAFTNITNYVMNSLPSIIDHHLKMSKAHDEAENAFYSRFSTLDRAKHGGDVVSFAKAFRSSGQSMSNEDFLAMVGAAVMAKHGLTAVAAPPGANGVKPAPKPQPQAPFSPAPSGASPARVVVEKDEWGGLDHVMDDE